jgi:hypothetical protein
MQVNFDDSQLPPITIEQIYRNLLVELEPLHSQEKESGSDVPFLGNNQQHILLIVNEPGSKYLPDSNYKFLTGILGACKLNLNDIAIVNLHNLANRNYSGLLTKLQPKVVMLFGASPAEIELPVNFPQFQVQPYNNALFLSVPDLRTIESDKLIKSKLWLCLKQIFSL